MILDTDTDTDSDGDTDTDTDGDTDTDACAAGMDFYAPGCGVDPGMKTIEAGCYAPCKGVPCETGFCQRTDINPCMCTSELDCCDACGKSERLCLDTPEVCAYFTEEDSNV